MPVYAAPDGVPGNDGSESAPWRLQHAIDHLDVTDDHVLLLLAGVYVGSFDIAGLEHPDPPYVISAAPGAIVVIDGTVPEFRTIPNDLWQHVGGADSDEYVDVGVPRGRPGPRVVPSAPPVHAADHPPVPGGPPVRERAGRADLSGQPAGWSSASPTRARARSRRYPRGPGDVPASPFREVVRP
jgi:hypothetical protein